MERNSIYSFSKELSIQRQDFFDQAKDFVTSGSFNSSSTIERYFKRSTRYPLAIRDGLSIAEDLSNTSKKRSEFAGLAEEIESDLLFGTVNVNKDGEVQFTSNKAKRLKIPIQLSASIVKTLSSLVFYLKHKAEQNDLIIIDEPELNLHPSNQVFFN
ncbi:AAA family ATPase [Sphingobacterium daejeonense]|uniref:AAA family ATPase n=1 Tax=Sphingobacterium daejeonense TaxID=371142 RepID=UPI001484E1F4|nr:AAA family ATPase [Sphingobacterium daejeonense]